MSEYWPKSLTSVVRKNMRVSHLKSMHCRLDKRNLINDRHDESINPFFSNVPYDNIIERSSNLY